MNRTEFLGRCFARYFATKRFSQFKLGVIGAPFGGGQPRPGVELGPDAIRRTGFMDTIANMGHDVKDFGDVEARRASDDDIGPHGEKNLTSVLQYNLALSKKVFQVLQEGRLCVTLGGDHSMAIGTLRGHHDFAEVRANNHVATLWVDAHADIQVGCLSSSGNMHGMPLGYLLQERKEVASRIQGWPQPCLTANCLAYIGLRDVEENERKFLDECGILSFWMEDVDQLGLVEVMRRCLSQLSPSNSRPLHLSFDIDSLDPSEAPSTGTPVRGGLTLREGLKIVETCVSTGHLCCFDLVEVNPKLGSERDVDYTLAAARSLLVGGLTGHWGTYPPTLQKK